ncbi:hypothetical protein D9M71_237770 [compost metagenome]
MPAQRLDRMGQTIEGIGGKQQAIEQQGVGRHCRFTQPRALYGDQEEHRLQRQAADEDVAVDAEQRPPALPARQQRPGDLPRVGAQGRPGQGQAEQGGAPFGNHRGAGRTDHAPVQAEHEPQIEGDVEQVGSQQDRQRRLGVLGAEEPADQGEAGQRRRQPEQASLEEVVGRLLQRRRRLHQLQGQVAERQGQQAQQQGKKQRQQQALQQHLA